MKLTRVGRQYSLDFAEHALHMSDMPQTPFIDHSFPVEEANALARTESYNKHLYRPNTYLHKWWARRCGTTFRFILKQLVASQKARDFYAPGGLEGRIVIDPMMGGGTTLHEAIRLNANVVGADIDPIPVLQARATLCEIDLCEMQQIFGTFLEGLRERLADWFKTECPECGKATDFQFMLYGIRKHCRCREVLMVESFTLRRERDVTITLCNGCGWIGDSAADHRCDVCNPALFDKTAKKCDRCGQPFTEAFEMPLYLRYVPVAVVGTCQEHGRFFRAPADQDNERLANANAVRDAIEFGDCADFTVLGGPKSDDLLRRGIHSYLDLFSTRQLMYLSAASEAIQSLPDWARLNLSLLVSTSLEFNSMLCGYKGSDERAAGAIRHTFGLHAYCFQYTAAENNPIYPKPASGNLPNLFRDRIVRGREWSRAPVERAIGRDGKLRPVVIHGEVDSGTEVTEFSNLTTGSHRFLVCQTDSRNLPIPSNSVDYVVTDPPYYDNVQYSDLASFFRVWLKKLLLRDVDWAYDMRNSAVAANGNGRPNGFAANLGAIFRECARVLKPEVGRMVFSYHHWDPDAWADLTIALRQGDFVLRNYYVIHSENPISSHIQNLKALTHDCILVLSERGSPAETNWSPVESIDTTNSERFCEGCGPAIGWMLFLLMSDDEIRDTWRKLIQRS